MAPKKIRSSPLDDPPTASSSSDDEQKPSTKKPEDEIVEEEEEEDSSDDDDQGSSSEDEEEQVQPTPPSKPASNNPPPSTPISNPKPSSGSESESESGSEADSEREPTPPPNAKVKPLASKPMKLQPQAQSTPVPARSGTKRAVENNASGNGSKRSKKKTTAGGGSDDENEADGVVKMTGEDSKKFHRIFNEEDELVILKGLAEFISKTGKDPMKEPAAFHRFVKKLLHADANSDQLKRKVHGLKKKFETSANFTKAHDKKAFELFKKVWGNNGSNEAEENGKTSKSTKKDTPIRNNGSAKNELVTEKDTGKVESDVEKSLSLSEMFSFGEAVGSTVVNKDAMKRGTKLMAESKRDELDDRWKKIQIAEMEVFVARLRLIKDQTRLAVESYKKSIN